MNNIQVVKAQLRLQQWAERIAECQASPMTVEAWCNANEINVKTYYYWLKKVRTHTLENSPIPTNNLPVRSAQQDEHITFKPLEVKSPVPGMQAAVIVHLPQATLEVAQGTDQQTVEAVLLALKSVC